MHSLLHAISHQLKEIIDKIDTAFTEKKTLPWTYADCFSSLLDVEYEGLNIYWFDKEHRLLFMNASQALPFKQSRENLVGKTMFELGDILGTSHSDSQRNHEHNQVAMNSKVPLLFEEEANGNYYLSYKMPFYNRRHELQGMFGISTNITAQKQIQKLLYASKHATDVYLESILLSSQNNIYWMDTQGCILGCNDQQARVMGFSSRMDLIGKNIFDIGNLLGWDEAIPQRIRENDLYVMQTKETIFVEEHTLFEGEEHFYLSSKSPMLTSDGTVIGVLGIATEITKQKRIEKELEKAKQKAEAASESKTRFIANISHDIRTPLVGIQGIAAELAEHIPPKFKSKMEGLRSASHELLTLLNNVITYAKFELDDPAHNPTESFNLFALVNSLIILLTPVAKDKQLALTLSYSDDIPQFFVGMPFLIQRSILNLITNALKFTEHGHVTVSVSRDPHVCTLADNVFPLRMTVEDTGIGIPKHQLSEIFESFHRVVPRYQDKYCGSGLGLSIVQDFVKKLGGTISVESELGAGSRFFIHLPLTLSQAHHAHRPVEITDEMKDMVASLQIYKRAPIKQKKSKKSRKARILLVEDHPLIQEMTTTLLNKLCGDVDTADNAAQAIELAKKNIYDLIFMDLGLPDHDGFWTTQQIRALAPHYEKTPIIALTAHLELDSRDTCLQAGLTDMITKPLTVERAIACLDRYALRKN